MNRVASLFSAGALCAAFLFTSSASADSLTVDSSQSVLNFGIDIGIYQEEGNPDSFFPLFSAVGQGSGVPVGPGKLPGPVTPGFSDGLSAQAAGTVNVTPGNFSIDSSAVSLLDSGKWQPGTNTTIPPADPVYDNVAVSGELGGFLEGYLFNAPPDPFDLYAVAAINNLVIALTTGSVPLGPGGSFSDPSGGLALNSADIDVQANLGSFQSNVASPIAEVLALSGTYTGGVLTLPLSGFFDQEIPTDLLTLIARISVNGQIVASAPIVPEPSSFALLGLGLAGLGAYGYRRRK